MLGKSLTAFLASSLQQALACCNCKDNYVLKSQSLVSRPFCLSHRIPSVPNTEKCEKPGDSFGELEQSVALETSLMNLGGTDWGRGWQRRMGAAGE